MGTILTEIVGSQYLLSGPLGKHLWTRGCHFSRKGTKDNRETYGRGCMPGYLQKHMVDQIWPMDCTLMTLGLRLVSYLRKS